MDHDSDSTKWLAAAFVLLILAIIALLPWGKIDSSHLSSPALTTVPAEPNASESQEFERLASLPLPPRDVPEESNLSPVSTSKLMVVEKAPSMAIISEASAPAEGEPPIAGDEPKTETGGSSDSEKTSFGEDSRDSLLADDRQNTGDSVTENHVLATAADAHISSRRMTEVVHADAEYPDHPAHGHVQVTPFLQDIEHLPFALQIEARDRDQVHAFGISSFGFTPVISKEQGYTRFGHELLERNNLILCNGIQALRSAPPVVVSELPFEVGSDNESDGSIVAFAFDYQVESGELEKEQSSESMREKSSVDESHPAAEQESPFGIQTDILTVAAPPVETDGFWEAFDASLESEPVSLAAPLNQNQQAREIELPASSTVDSSKATLSTPLGSSINSISLGSPGSGEADASVNQDELQPFVAASMVAPMLQEALPTPPPALPTPSPTDSDQSEIADEEEDREDSDQEDEDDSAAETDASGEDNSDDEKKMLGHLVGQFGYCFRSALSCGFYFGNEFTFLGVESPGYTRVRLTDSVSDSVDQFTGDDAFGFGNRVTLGLRAKNIGFRAIYWAFTAENSSHDALNDIDRSPDFSTSSTARLETFDFDLTQNYCIMGCNLTSSCGFRFAEFQGSELTHLAGEISDLLQATASTLSHKSMRGFGPSFSMELRKTIPWCLGSPAYMPQGQFDPGCSGCFGCCGSDCNSYGACGGCGGCDSCGLGSPCFPWRVYFNTRISLLWADTYSESMTDSVMATGPGVVTQGLARSRDFASLSEEEKATLLSTQIQLGLEYQQPVFCNSALFKMRFGLEFQMWNLGESASMSESFAFLTDPNDSFDGRVEAVSRSDNEYLDLFGFTFLIGLNY